MEIWYRRKSGTFDYDLKHAAASGRRGRITTHYYQAELSNPIAPAEKVLRDRVRQKFRNPMASSSRERLSA
jgi:hypothetical protein